MQPTSHAAMSGGRRSGSENGEVVRAGAKRLLGPRFPPPARGLDLDGQGAAGPKGKNGRNAASASWGNRIQTRKTLCRPGSTH